MGTRKESGVCGGYGLLWRWDAKFVGAGAVAEDLGHDSRGVCAEGVERRRSRRWFINAEDAESREKSDRRMVRLRGQTLQLLRRGDAGGGPRDCGRGKGGSVVCGGH